MKKMLRITTLFYAVLGCIRFAAAQTLIVTAGGPVNYTLTYPATLNNTVPPGMLLTFRANSSNTGAVTLNLNSSSNITVKKNFDQDLTANDIKTNSFVTVIYDGTNWQMLSVSATPGGNVSGTGASGGVNFWTGASTQSTDAANFFWDNTGKRLGVGTNTPTQALQVAGGNILTDRAYISSPQSIGAVTPGIFNTGALATSQITITDNSNAGANGNFTYGATAIEGQYLWITNGDAQDVNFASTSPITTIPSQTTMCFVFIGGSFRAVEANPVSPINLKPTGASAGQTGSIRLQELAVNGTNGIGLRAADNLLSDVILTLPNNAGANGQFLRTDGSGGLSWVNGSALSGSGSFGQVNFWSGGSIQSGSNNFFWDNTNNRLGIGTNAPTAPLHVVSATINSIYATTSSTSANSAAVNGENTALTGQNSGVRGISQSATFPSAGVKGESSGANGSGVLGLATALTGYGVFGDYTAAGGGTGVLGRVLSASANNSSIGVLGINFGNGLGVSSIVENPTAAERTSLEVITTQNGTATNGLGTRIALSVENSAGSSLPIGYITATATNVANGNMAGDLSFSTFNANIANKRMTIKDNGNVGVGTSTPNAKLDISGGAIMVNGGLTNASARPAITNTRISGEIAGYSTSGPTADDGFLRLSAGGGTNVISKTYIDLSGFSNIPDMDKNIVFGTAGTEKMRIVSNGNVGIGTGVSVPGAKLDIGGNTANTLQAIFARGDADPNFILRVKSGTASLIAKFGLEYTVPIIDNASINFYRGATNNDGYMAFSTFNTDRVTILSNGNVGIGTTNPIRDLTVINDNSNTSWITAIIGGDGSNNVIVIGNDAGRATVGAHTSDLLGWAHLYLNPNENGLVRIGSIDPPTAALHVTGNILATGTISSSSDLRYKKDISNLSNTLSKLKKLNGVHYKWRTEEFKNMGFDSTLQIGFIAQEVEKIYPQLVLTAKDSAGYKSVDYSRFTPILVEAIKEQQKLIEQLQEENKTYRSQNTTLTNQSASLQSEIDAIKRHLGLDVKSQK